MNWTEVGTFLFIPADADRMVAGAHKRGAGAIILDLEDAIAPSNKDAARDKLAGSVAILAAQGLTVVVRVNNEPDRLVDDIRAAAIAGVRAVILPKVESARFCQFADGALAAAERGAGLSERSIGLIPVIEHPAAMRALDEIAAATPRVVALGFGSEDYASAIGTPATFESMAMPAQAVAIAARGRGPAPRMLSATRAFSASTRVRSPWRTKRWPHRPRRWRGRGGSSTRSSARSPLAAVRSPWTAG